MAINSVRAALQLLSGAGELTRARAMEAAATLLELPGIGDTSMRAGQLAEELLQAATANQQLVHDLVRTEFERRLTRLGVVRESDLESALRRIDVLEAQVAALRAGGPQPAPGATTVRRRPAKKAAAKKTTGKRAAKKTTPKSDAAGKSTSSKPTAAGGDT